MSLIEVWIDESERRTWCLAKIMKALEGVRGIQRVMTQQRTMNLCTLPLTSQDDS